jgi:hypothetical protein
MIKNLNEVYTTGGDNTEPATVVQELQIMVNAENRKLCGEDCDYFKFIDTYGPDSGAECIMYGELEENALEEDVAFTRARACRENEVK